MRQSHRHPCLRMNWIQFFLVLSLVVTYPTTANPISGNCYDFEYLLVEYREWFEDIKDFGSTMAEFGFGDHIDWEYLESYSIAGAEWKNKLVENLNGLLEELKNYIEMNTLLCQDELYEHDQLFRLPANGNNWWVAEVSLASDNIIHWLDKLNIALNGGYFSGDRNTFKKRQLEDRMTALKIISKVINFIDIGIGKELPEYLIEFRDDDLQRSLTEYMNNDLNFKNDVDCLYSWLDTNNLTFYNTFTETIPKERLVSFCREFVSKLFEVINSEEIESNIQTIREGLQTIIRHTNFNPLFSKMSLIFFQSRSLLLDVDIVEMFNNLDSLHRTLGEGLWNITTGKWSEMVQFIDTFQTNTINSEIFWHNVDNLYLLTLPYFKTQQHWLETNIKTKMIPFFMKVLEFAQTKDKSQITSLIARLHSMDMISYLEPMLDENGLKVLSSDSRNYLSCYTAIMVNVTSTNWSIWHPPTLSSAS